MTEVRNIEMAPPGIIPDSAVPEPQEYRKEITTFPEIKINIDNKEIEKAVLPVLQQIALEKEKLLQKSNLTQEEKNKLKQKDSLDPTEREELERKSNLTSGQLASLQRYEQVIDRVVSNASLEENPWVTLDQINARVDMVFGQDAAIAGNLISEVNALLQNIDLTNPEQTTQSDSKLMAIRHELQNFAEKTNYTWEHIARGAGASDTAISALRNAGKDTSKIKDGAGDRT